MQIALLPYHWFKNPHSPLTKWIYLAPTKQSAVLATTLIIMFSVSLWQGWQNQRHNRQIDAELLERQQQLTHQQRLLGVLQQKSNPTQLTPELAARLPPVNEQIQRLMGQYRLQPQHSQWTFFHAPALNLQIQGHFLNLHRFLTALLTAFPDLKLLNVHIEQLENRHSEQSVSIELNLQLQ